MVYKSLLFFITLTFVVVINSMELETLSTESSTLSMELATSLPFLPRDVFVHKIQPFLSLHEIAQFKRSSKAFNQMSDPEKICLYFDQQEFSACTCAPLEKEYCICTCAVAVKNHCSDTCLALKDNYQGCTRVLGHLAYQAYKYRKNQGVKGYDKQFRHLWRYHARTRVNTMIICLNKSEFTWNERMKFYSKYYRNLKAIGQINLNLALMVMNMDNPDIRFANAILAGGKASIFDGLKIAQKRAKKTKKIFLDNQELAKGFYFDDTLLSSRVYNACSFNNAELLYGLCGGIIDNQAFEYIIRYASVNLLIDLIEKGMLCPDAIGYGGKSVLHYAAAKGEINLIDLLLARQVYVNYPDDMGMTPLHYAIQNIHIQAVSRLLKNTYINIYAANKSGRTAYSYGVPVKKSKHDAPEDKINRKEICTMLKEHAQTKPMVVYNPNSWYRNSSKTMLKHFDFDRI